MAFHANGGLNHRAVLHARQDTHTDSTTTTTRTRRLATRSSSSSTSSSTVDRTTSVLSSSATTSTTDTPKRLTSSSLVVARPTSTSKVNLSTVNKGNIPFPTSASSIPSSDPTAAADSVPTQNGSIAGGIIGTLAAIAAIALIAAFIVRRTRKRRDRLNDARDFDKERLERPGMVQGIAAGPGVRSRSPSIMSNIEKTLPPAPYPSSPQPEQSFPASVYGAPYPFSPSLAPGPPYHDGHQELGAAPIPGISAPAPYSQYMTPATSPGSPFTGEYPMRNPFATPTASEDHSSTPASAPAAPAAWAHIPMPLLPGGAFRADTYRDSGYSAAYSEAQVEQAYKVQVGVSMPKLEDLAREELGNPPPPFTPFDPAAAATVNPADVVTATPPATVNKTTIKPLPPRPPSAHTVYEDAYGGV